MTHHDPGVPLGSSSRDAVRIMTTIAPSSRGNGELAEFFPMHGYDIPDLSRVLVLALLETEIRLSHKDLADMSSSDVRVILQVYEFLCL
jgi:hypothetical protein